MLTRGGIDNQIILTVFDVIDHVRAPLAYFVNNTHLQPSSVQHMGCAFCRFKSKAIVAQIAGYVDDGPLIRGANTCLLYTSDAADE